jgi:diacylglycerol kinase
MEHAKPNKPFSVRVRAASFRYALQGLVRLFVQEHNMRIHLAATIVVVVAGCVKQLDARAWIAICIAIGLVWITEALNTAVEMMCDLFGRNMYHPTIKIIKDISAAAVLIAALVSVVIAGFVFLR